MATISGKHVVILGSAMGLADALYQQFELGNLPASQFTLEQLPFQQSKALEQRLLRAKPTLIVNTLPLELPQADSPRREDVVACTRAVVNVCRQKSIKLLQLSSARVFEGGDKKTYDENEKPTVHSEVGRQLLACEECLAEDLEHWILLRLAWVIDTDGDNVFTRYMQQFMQEGKVAADSSVRLAPIWLDDALRVVATIVRQLLAGAENWGVFHYGSADPCSEREFVQQMIASLADLKPDWPTQLQSVAADKQQKTSSVLKSRRVRNNFGVHGRTWRQGLKARMQFWLDSQEDNCDGETVTLSSAGGNNH